MDGEAEPTMRLHLHVSHAVQELSLRDAQPVTRGLSWYGRVKSGGYHVPPADYWARTANK